MKKWDIGILYGLVEISVLPFLRATYLIPDGQISCKCTSSPSSNLKKKKASLYCTFHTKLSACTGLSCLQPYSAPYTSTSCFNLLNSVAFWPVSALSYSKSCSMVYTSHHWPIRVKTLFNIHHAKGSLYQLWIEIPGVPKYVWGHATVPLKEE